MSKFKEAKTIVKDKMQSILILKQFKERLIFTKEKKIKERKGK
jgi:hypothetical protein